MTRPKPPEKRDLRHYRNNVARAYARGQQYVLLPLSIAAEILAGYDAAQELREQQGQPTKISARPVKQETSQHDRSNHSNG